MAKEKTLIKRTYAHRTFGAIGEARLRVMDDGTMEFAIGDDAFAPLDASGTEHFLMFALQTLQDAYAGSTTRDEACAAFDKKADRIVSGDIGTRGGGVDQWTSIARGVVRDQLRKVGGAVAAAYKAADDAAGRNAILDAIIETNRDKIDKRVRKIMTERAESLDLDVDVDL